MKTATGFARGKRRATPPGWLLTAAALFVLVAVPATALGLARSGSTAGKPNLDVNAGRIAPTAAQRQLVSALGAHAAWNRFGTPSSVIRLKGYLATGLDGDAVQVARAFLQHNRALYKLSSANSLQVVNDLTLTGTKAHAVLFAQSFGSLAADWEGLIAVGVVGDKVAYVSSSAAGGQLTGSAKLSPTEAWKLAAQNVGVPTDGDVGALVKGDGGWTYFQVAGLTGLENARSTQAHESLPPLPGVPSLPALPPLPSLPGTGSGGSDGSGGSTGGATGGAVDTSALLQQLQSAIASLYAGSSTGSTGGAGASATPTSQVTVAVTQGAKLVAFPTLHDGVRPAWLVNVVDLRNVAVPAAYQVMVDAANGQILFRHDAVQEASTDSSQPAYTFTGAYDPPNCDADQTFSVGPGQKSIAAAASAVNPSNDIILDLVDPSGNVVANSDTATSPEAVLYQAPGGADVAAGTWALRVCPFNGASLQPPVPNQTAPYTYVAAATVSTASAQVPSTPRPKPPTAVTNNPRWAFFPSFPGLDYGATPQTEGCWQNADDGLGQPAACAQTFANPYSPFGWDVIPRDNQATLTTRGNNAFTAEAWLSPLTPAEQKTPVSTDRYYDRNFPGGNFVWTNSWNRNQCNPATLGDPTQNNADVDAATTNLFVMHNRMHDFAYALGFTEQAYNAQLDNLDKSNGGTGPYPLGREGDPELGDAQAGAVDGGYPSYEGRDNANQVTLNDGVPPITNQYLWQPIAGSFYSPCTDGSFDLSVAGHEYTHLISNRMVGGPDASLSSAQGGAMGESWSDLDALEFLHEYGLAGARGEEPWSLGAYVTGNPQKGIRDYALDQNPLNYSDVGFDTTGPEVHADGEIWNGVNFEVRSALVAKYGEGTTAENIACAKGETPVSQCSGGRRWIQLVYDAWLLEQGDLSMVDARDAMLAADLMRFGGADETELWHAFAKRGLGISASSTTGDDDQPTPGFDSPKEANAQVSFVTTAADGSNAGQPVAADVYVGDFQARVTPVADTDPATRLGNAAGFVPATYHFIVQAPGYGMVEFDRELAAGTQTLSVSLPHNWASTANDATATGDGVNLNMLIDDNEGTNWASLSGAVAGKEVTVMLHGRHVLTAGSVSGLNHPSTCDGVAEEQGVCAGGSGQPDDTAQSRFSALRSFTLLACDASATNCSNDANWTVAYDSAPDFFPAVRPRPTAPDERLRSFPLSGIPATEIRLVVKTNQCTGAPDFQGQQDNDPVAGSTDCNSTAHAQEVRAAELEVVSGDATVTDTSGTTALAQTQSGSSTQSSASAPAAKAVVRGSSAPQSSATPQSSSAPAVAPTWTQAGGTSAAHVTLRRLLVRAVYRLPKTHQRVALTVRVLTKSGLVRYSDAAHRIAFSTTRIGTVAMNYRLKTATLAGLALVRGRLVRFTLVLHDGSRADAFQLRLANGYRLAGTLPATSLSI